MMIPEKQGSQYYRGFLTQQGQTIYNCINAQLLRGDYSGKTPFSITKPDTAASDCFSAFRAIRDDHPEYFYLGFRSKYTCRGLSGFLEYPILYTDENIRRIQLQLRKSIYRIVRGSANLSTIEREQLVYSRIAKKLSYVNHGDVRDHNIVGPILTLSGVCEGYNALLLLCFRRIGIPCIKVYGNNNSHCWTIAWINGKPVHCDVTWDGMNDKCGYYRYFNLSDEQISFDHYSFRRSTIPQCI